MATSRDGQSSPDNSSRRIFVEILVRFHRFVTNRGVMVFLFGSFVVITIVTNGLPNLEGLVPQLKNIRNEHERDVGTEKTVINVKSEEKVKKNFIDMSNQLLPIQNMNNYMSTDVRRRLASTLVEIYGEIVRHTGQQSGIDVKLAIKLAAVVQELDSRVSLSLLPRKENSARLGNVTSAKQLPNNSRHVCPEVFKPDKNVFGQTGMEQEVCNYVPEFSKVLTIVLPAVSWTVETVNFVIKQIRTRYSITIIPVVLSKAGIDTSVPNVRLEVMEKGANDSTTLNQLLKTIQTPFVLIGTSLAHFNNQSSLERLVRILDELEHVKVVGGAARDMEGVWTHGCLQQRMAVYEAHYAVGYYYSKFECMYCDDLLTPFVTSVALIEKIPFQEHLSGNAMYRDWFARLRANGIVSMTCPDVMFYVQDHPTMDQQQWLTVAQEWYLEKITSFDDKVYVFECSAVGINCFRPLGTITYYQLAPCCRAIMTKYLTYLTNYGKKNNLHYELHAGSALGAVKMGGYLPWDYDNDISYLCKDFKTWRNSNPMLKMNKCYNYVNVNNVYITVQCPGYFLELYCHHYNKSTHRYLPPEYEDKPTIIKYGGAEVAVRPNPGLYARNRYGFEYLKHESHWRVVIQGSPNFKYHDVRNWRPCKNPMHHSCLDHYPVDGNLPFLKPFLNL